MSTVAWPINSTTTLPGTPFSCAQEEYVRVKVSHVARGIPCVQRLVAEIATVNRTWGEERIASELLVQLETRASPRTVRRSMPSGFGPDRALGC